MKTTTMFAAVGDDGLRPVVWGVGNTEEAAREDACRWLNEAPTGVAVSQELAIHEITTEQADAIRAGAVAWPIQAR